MYNNRCNFLYVTDIKSALFSPINSENPYFSLHPLNRLKTNSIRTKENLLFRIGFLIVFCFFAILEQSLLQK